MASVWHSRPVFITSTFRDMHAERDHLRNVVFPALEERLRERRVYLEPIDLRLQVKVQTIDSEYYFRSSRLRLELLPDGRARGLFAGYQDVANFYDINGGHRLARSASHFLGFTCPGLYAAAQRMADGHPDPETGACTSLSTALEVEALPAFVIHPEAVAWGEAT